ncbi:hypothetical protein QYM36_006899 [Artemia franciscana]|uniref:Uncharacterized protein n=1 Tax=Artemia franciscana TaxID=6661 RepID=A0AA88HUN1_ARTSF|nr:hypothetical protein QYM36_006899 [Artemia franciscana]
MNDKVYTRKQIVEKDLVSRFGFKGSQEPHNNISTKTERSSFHSSSTLVYFDVARDPTTSSSSKYFEPPIVRLVWEILPHNRPCLEWDNLFIDTVSFFRLSSRQIFSQQVNYEPHLEQTIMSRIGFGLALTLFVEVQVPSNQCETVFGHLSKDESIVQLLLPVELVARQSYYSHVESY